MATCWSSTVIQVSERWTWQHICLGKMYYFVIWLSKIILNLRKKWKWFLHANTLELSHWKTPSNLRIQFQRYSHFSDAPYDKIQRKLNAFIGSIHKSILPSSDSFCFITSQMYLFTKCVCLFVHLFGCQYKYIILKSSSFTAYVLTEHNFETVCLSEDGGIYSWRFGKFDILKKWVGKGKNFQIVKNIYNIRDMPLFRIFTFSLNISDF